MLHTFILLPSIFFVSSHLLLPSSSFFFLSQGHMKQKNGSYCSFQRLFQPESVCFGGHFSRISCQFHPNQLESSQINTNQKKKEKKKGRVGVSDTGRRIGAFYGLIEMPGVHGVGRSEGLIKHIMKHEWTQIWINGIKGHPNSEALKL